MKRVFLAAITFLFVLILCSCDKGAEKKDVLCVRFFCEDEAERDEVMEDVARLLKGAESKDECLERLREAGFCESEEYYKVRRCGGKFFPAGYYTTVRVGTGKNGWQYVAYPTLTYQSLEVYDNARYGSFFYEIVKKMEERDENEEG